MKADATLIRQAYELWNAQHKKSITNDSNPSAILAQLHENGGYDVLTAASKAKIPAANLPKLVARNLVLATFDIKGIWQPTYLDALVVDELEQGRVILWTGTVPLPTISKSAKIQTMRDDKSPGYSYPKTSTKTVYHAQLITGYYVIYNQMKWKQEIDLFWEIRGNWGSDYADNGYAYFPAYDVNIYYQPSLVSLALE